MKRFTGFVLALGLAGAGAGCGPNAADRVLTAKADIKVLEKAVRAYCVQKGDYPESLQALVEEGVLTPAGLRDPWELRYRYDPSGTKNRGLKPDIWTVTPDRATIGNWAKEKQAR
jgi:hypothetical protein